MIKTQEWWESQILDLLDQRIALSTGEIAKEFRMSVNYAGNIVGRMDKQNMARWPLSGPGRWCLRKNLHQYRVEHDAEIAERLRVRKAKKYRASKERIDQATEAWANEPPRVVVVSAANAPKMRLRGPASVWDFAGHCAA